VNSFELEHMQQMMAIAAKYRAQKQDTDNTATKLARLSQLSDELRVSGTQVHSSTKF
jgi:hypothetical protein